LQNAFGLFGGVSEPPRRFFSLIGHCGRTIRPAMPLAAGARLIYLSRKLEPLIPYPEEGELR
jgi:hypothetical protein